MRGAWLVAVALLDAAFHHDEQVLGRRAARNDRLAGAEIADVERRAHALHLRPGQPVERCVCGIEAERQAMAFLFGTEDRVEGMGAFLAKREASFKGR